MGESRTDSILNTGMTSHTINKAERMKKARENRNQIKQAKRTKLMPAAEVVITELDKEKQNTEKMLLEQINVNTPDQSVKDIIVALNLYGESLNKLKSRLSNIMREKQ